MKKANALQSALRSEGKAPASPAPANDTKPAAAPKARQQPAPAVPAIQASRRDTKPITVHFPEDVRRQLKSLAADEGRNMDDMVAEALNLLFVKYRKAEIAPRRK